MDSGHQAAVYGGGCRSGGKILKRRPIAARNTPYERLTSPLQPENPNWLNAFGKFVAGSASKLLSSVWNPKSWGSCSSSSSSSSSESDSDSGIAFGSRLGFVWNSYNSLDANGRAASPKMETNAYRKRKSKRNAAPWQGQRVQAEGLPTGWLLGKKTRSQGRGYNKYYIQPGTGKVFKSRKAVERFLEQQVNLKNNLGQHILQCCQSSDMNDSKVEKVVDEKIQQVDEMEEQVNWKNDLGERILQPCQSRDLNSYEEVRVEEAVDEKIEQVEDEEEEEEEKGGGDDGEGFVEGFNLEANDDSVDRDGLTDHIPYSSHGISAIDLFGSRDDSFMSHGGPSFFDNRGKRVMEPEENMHHLDGNGKRLKADQMWDDQKQNGFDFCMVQAQQWMEKAKMITNSSEEFYANSKYQQDSAMNELRMTIKSKDEELANVNYEVFRLERELYLMGDLVTWYRKALNDTRIKFSEYRKRVALQEEPLFKDAGPGGMVLSTRELEKQRLKQKETQKPRDELELSTGSEKNQKSRDKLESSQKPVENQKSHDESSRQ